MKKRNNPGISSLLLLGGAGAAYYFLVHKPKMEKEKAKAVVKAVAAVASPGGITGKQTGYTLPLLTSSGRLSTPASGSLYPPLTLAGGSLGSGGAGSLG
jgi:hypothetical protein